MSGIVSLLPSLFFLPLYSLMRLSTSVSFCMFMSLLHAGELGITINCWQEFGAFVTARNV